MHANVSGDAPLKPDSPGYKEALFNRAKMFLSYKEGERVRISGTRNCGTIQKIYYEFEDVQWKGNVPYFIEVLLDNGESWTYNKRQLTRKKVTK